MQEDAGSNETDPGDKPADRVRRRSRSNTGALVLVVVLIGIVVGVGWYLASRSDDADNSPGSTAATQVSDSDEVVVDIPQEPSLRLFEEDGTWYVENDGNVTMSEVEVADGSGAVVCELGTLSPDDREACEGASGDDLVARGSGPQGQPVEVGPAG